MIIETTVLTHSLRFYFILFPHGTFIYLFIFYFSYVKSLKVIRNQKKVLKQIYDFKFYFKLFVAASIHPVIAQKVIRF